MFLRYGFTATGSGGNGTVYLVGAHIGGHLDCTRAELRNDSGPALDAYSLQVGQGMYLAGGFTATGGGERCGQPDRCAGGREVRVRPAEGWSTRSILRRLAVDGLTYAWCA